VIRREKLYTIGLPNGQGPSITKIQMNLVDSPTKLEIEAWIGNFGSSNVYILEGGMSLAVAQNRVLEDLAPDGQIDCLFALSGSAPVKAEVSQDTRHITVFFETANASGQTETVTVKVIEYV
jgi:hypothetical protein